MAPRICSIANLSSALAAPLRHELFARERRHESARAFDELPIRGLERFDLRQLASGADAPAHGGQMAVARSSPPRQLCRRVPARACRYRRVLATSAAVCMENAMSPNEPLMPAASSNFREPTFISRTPSLIRLSIPAPRVAATLGFDRAGIVDRTERAEHGLRGFATIRRQERGGMRMVPTSVKRLAVAGVAVVALASQATLARELVTVAPAKEGSHRRTASSRASTPGCTRTSMAAARPA